MIKDCLIQNFGCIKEIKIDCNDVDVFIIGENGTGKTSILQAISLALSGKTAKKIRISDFVGPYGDDFLIKITLDDGTQIERRKDRGKLILSNGQTFDKITDIYSFLPFDPDLFFNVGYVKQGEIAEFFENDRDLIDKLLNLVINIKRIDNAYLIVNKTLSSVSKEIETLKNTKHEKPDIDKDEILKEITLLKSKIVNIDINELQQQKKLYDEYKYLLSKISVVENNLNNLDAVSKPEKDISTAKQLLLNTEKLKEAEKVLNDAQIRLNGLTLYKDEVAPIYKQLLAYAPSLWKASYSAEDLQHITNTKQTITRYMTTEDHTDDYNEFNNLIDFIKSKWDIDSESILQATSLYKKINEKLKTNRILNDIMKEINTYHPTSTTLDDIINTLINEYTSKYEEAKRQYDIFNNEPHITTDEFTKLSNEWAKYNNYIHTKQQYENDLIEFKKQLSAVEKKLKYTEEELNRLTQSIESNKMIMDNIQSKENLLKLYKMWETDEVKRQQELDELCKKEERLSKLKTYLKQLPIVMRKVLFEPIQDIINNDFFEIFSFSNLGSIKIDWEKVELKIGDLNYDQLSGAQRCTLALTLRLALLKRLGMHMPLMLIDEPTNHLDSRRISDLVKYFSLLHKQTQMFVATHNIDILPELNAIVIDTSK